MRLAKLHKAGVCMLSASAILTSAAQPPQVLFSVTPPVSPSGDGLIALTFDDGPRPANLQPLLDALAAYGMTATFCVQGNNIEANPGWVRKVAEAGHQVENHSFSHPNFMTIPSSSWDAELRRTHELILAETGRAPKFFRPPNLAYNEELTAFCAETFGYRILISSLSTLDWSHTQTGMLLPAVQGKVKPGDIVLCHEVPTTAADIELLLTWLRSQGLHSVTIDQLEAYSIADAPPPPRPIRSGDRILIDFGSQAARSSRPDAQGLFWNNVIVPSWEGALHPAPLSAKGEKLACPIRYGSGFQFVDSDGYAGTALYGASAQRDGVYNFDAAGHQSALGKQSTVVISGLNPHLNYRLRVFAAAKRGDGSHGNLVRYTAAGQHRDLDVAQNAGEAATFENVTVDESGELVIGAGVSPEGNARSSYLSVIDLEATGPRDADQDGLPDDWEAAYGLSTQSGEGDNGPDGDPDSDGWTNARELPFSADPLERGGFPISVIPVAGASGAVLRFETRQGGTYTLQHAGLAGGDWVDGPSVTGDGASHSIPLPSPSGFFRLKVTTSTVLTAPKAN